MKKNQFLALSLTILLNISGFAQEGVVSYNKQIDLAANYIKAGQHLNAAQQLLSLSRAATIGSEKARAKYLFGLSLMELELNQTAAFQFVEVVRMGDLKWTRLAIEKLLIVTDRLGDETLLNFALQRIDVSQIPAQNREILYYRLAEIKHKAGAYEEAIKFYSQVGSQSRYYYSALYNMGLAQSESNQLDLALQTFNRLLGSRSGSKINDTNKVSAQMAIARVLYQKKEWTKAIEAYSKIPRDHLLWHDALFEKTWAMLRAGRYRSTLSNFQTLHSSYYENEYLPESLLLRAIVYLYICQYDEMEKVLSLYEKQYGPPLRMLSAFLQNSSNEVYFAEIDKTFIMKKNSEDSRKLALPYKLLKHVAEEGDVRRSYAYLKKVIDEKRKLEEDSQLRSSSVYPYATRILSNRIASTKSVLGELVKEHLANIESEITDLNEQASFIRYEMINGKKESIKKRMSERGSLATEVSDSSVEKQISFYIENGYEYYPFQGEYWLDEIGNYHYLGNQTCE